MRAVFINADRVGDVPTSHKAMETRRPGGTASPATSATAGSTCPIVPPRAPWPGIAIGRKAWLFAGSDRGGERAAAIDTLITIAKLNDVDPRAWLADVLVRINDHQASRLDELWPWNWKPVAGEAPP